MKNIVKSLIIGLAALALVSNARAQVTLSLVPTPQSIGVGDPASVDLVVSGLGNLAAPSLGAFDVDLTYNPVVVSANPLTFGTLLDLGTLGSIQFSDLSTPGLIHLDEVSFETATDLNNAQPDSFTLATLNFTGLAPGLSPLLFSFASLSDESAQTIQGVALTTGLIEVTGAPSVPDTGATATLLLGCMAGLWGYRRRLMA